MPSCSNCQSRGLSSYQVSELDSSRCAECVRLNRASCDVSGPSFSQLKKIVAQHSNLESELEQAEEERRRTDAKIERLRKQKKLWFEKMMRAVSRGIDSVEELERVEKEEAEREAQRAVGERPSSSGGMFSDIEIDPLLLSDDVALTPSFFASMGVTGEPSSVGEGSGVSGGTVARGENSS